MCRRDYCIQLCCLSRCTQDTSCCILGCRWLENWSGSLGCVCCGLSGSSWRSCIDDRLVEVRDKRCCLRILHRCCGCYMRTLQKHVLRRKTLRLLHKHRERVRPKQMIRGVRLHYRWPCLLIHIQVLGIDIVVLSDVIASIGSQEHIHHILQSLWICSSFLLIFY